jgi:lipoyl(octanoyl) transferase
VWLGRRRYEPVHALMQELQQARQQRQAPDTVLFVEHEPVVTLGRGATPAHVLVSPQVLEGRGVDLIATGRGGDVTLHAPGQLVCYPVIDLAPDRCDIRRYVRDLTETMRRLALDFGIGAGRSERYIGLWVDRAAPAAWPGEDAARRPAKLGAIGVRVSRWVTQHGFAFNLTTDLALYQLIVPCGISEHGVTSVEELTGQRIEVRRAADRALELLANVLDADVTASEDRSQQSLDLGKQVHA